MDKGIILSGGAGSRLYPLTLVASKQMQAVYDKPMIYYPLTTLMQCGIREICLISTPDDTPRFQALLGDGGQWGVSITYKVQPEPKGIAQAFLIARDFIGDEPICMILGDNLFHGHPNLPQVVDQFQSGGLIFAYRVKDPERYGVVEFDDSGTAISLEEKPKHPKSQYAVPGLYLYDNNVISICENLKPSARGELEITDVNLEYLRRGELRVSVMERGVAWLDTGTSSSLQEASNFIAIIEDRQGTKVGCPEEAARRKNFITDAQFVALIESMPKCEYSDYLRGVEHDMIISRDGREHHERA
ncbi:glucose-1-phosphate thymidylyltransferase RfbA [Candidatus Sumerlaeota bacterium]|nr:glucose-1-phosphate thymidylyltransferase RfbA [Candidatus Sumerlaeota bacterium]